VDHTVRDRLVYGDGVPESRLRVVYNGVDLTRFLPRGPLPERPRKALVFSNYVEPPQLEIVRAACEAAGIQLDAIGRHLGGECQQPEEVLGLYDIVLAKGRCAWEALACGTSVIVFDAHGCGPLVTSAELPALQRSNFGRRLLQQPVEQAVLARQLVRYSAADAAEVSRQVRAVCGLDRMLDRLLALYHEVIAEQRDAGADHAADLCATAAFLRRWPGLQSKTPTGALLATERNPRLASQSNADAEFIRRVVR